MRGGQFRATSNGYCVLVYFHVNFVHPIYNFLSFLHLLNQCRRSTVSDLATAVDVSAVAVVAVDAVVAVVSAACAAACACACARPDVFVSTSASILVAAATKSESSFEEVAVVVSDVALVVVAGGDPCRKIHQSYKVSLPTDLSNVSQPTLLSFILSTSF
ncbi:uncharacterized protein EV154DRAFT_487766 [Mucor mucedo]|uniref:uncharacterized protein n=1 Tax=Mucor mucedo TaxID=29922 RepID=UPI00221F42BA|nr:uncharacterized protein EV154DRAFT_487766 [Mucor mucedo]KAI7870707.1 hypothetical protein EV154DRAFT_487766 [Mucor mucedo]